MADHLVTITPKDGTPLVVTGALSLGVEVEWGDDTVELTLAEGTDVRGGRVGGRKRAPREGTLPFLIKADSAQAYVEAAHALETCVSALGDRGGVIRRQIQFPDGRSQALELEVLGAGIADPESGWLEAHRRRGQAEVTFTSQPWWLADEDEVGTEGPVTDSTAEITIARLRGNRDGPGRLVVADEDSQRRRYLEIGGAFRQYEATADAEYRAAVLDAGPDSQGTLVADAKAVGPDALEMTPLTPAWVVVGALSNLPHRGAHRVKARVRVNSHAEDNDVQHRILWRIDNGPWGKAGDIKTCERDDEYFEYDFGSVRRAAGKGDSIDLKIEARCSERDTTVKYRVDWITLMPTELYAEVEGHEVKEPSSGQVAYDFPFQDLAEGATLTGRVAMQGGTWTEGGSGGLTEFLLQEGGSKWMRRKRPDDSGVASGGLFMLLGTTNYTDITVAADLLHKYDGQKDTEARLGIVARYVDADNYLLACLKINRQKDGDYKPQVILYKRQTGTVTRLRGVEAQKTDIKVHSKQKLEGVLSLRVTTGGDVEVRCGRTNRSLDTPDLVRRDHHTALEPAGALATGKVGIYYIAQSDKPGTSGSFRQLIAYSTEDEVQRTSVVREDGTGVLTHEATYAADDDGETAKEHVPNHSGDRIWLPGMDDVEGGGVLYAKARSSMSRKFHDEDATLSTSYTLYHRAAYARLSDALE